MRGNISSNPISELPILRVNPPLLRAFMDMTGTWTLNYMRFSAPANQSEHYQDPLNMWVYGPNDNPDTVYRAVRAQNSALLDAGKFYRDATRPEVVLSGMPKRLTATEFIYNFDEREATAGLLRPLLVNASQAITAINLHNSSSRPQRRIPLVLGAV